MSEAGDPSRTVKDLSPPEDADALKGHRLLDKGRVVKTRAPGQVRGHSAGYPAADPPRSDRKQNRQMSQTGTATTINFATSNGSHPSNIGSLYGPIVSPAESIPMVH